MAKKNKIKAKDLIELTQDALDILAKQIELNESQMGMLADNIEEPPYTEDHESLESAIYG